MIQRLFFRGIFLPWLRRAGAWLFWPAAILVAWGELTPSPPQLEGLFLWDKLDHFTAYFGLALLATLGWGLRPSLFWVFLGVLAMGAGLEGLQALVGRDAEWGDLLANSLGAVTGLMLAAVYLAVPRRLVDGAARD
jgi:VanZ family protein